MLSCIVLYICLLVNFSRKRSLGISRVPLKSQAQQSTSLFTSIATNQRAAQRVVYGKLRSYFQRVRGDRVAVKVVSFRFGGWMIRVIRSRVFEEMTFSYEWNAFGVMDRGAG